MPRFPPSLLPGSVADRRGRSFGTILETAGEDWELRRLLVERIDVVDEALLPALVRECGIANLVEPGMRPQAIRALLKEAYALKRRTGYIDGVRRGLQLIGVEIVSWRQWFQATPPAPPGTHRVRLRLTDALFDADGRTYTARTQRAIVRMVDGMKRHSQDMALGFKITPEPLSMRFGMVMVNRVVVRPQAPPATTMQTLPLGAFTPIQIGMVAFGRLRVRQVTP